MPATKFMPALGAAVAAALLLSACSHSPSPATAAGVSTSPGSQPSASASANTVADTPPAMVAVTGHGALVTLNPTTGVVTKKLVPGHVMGDEVSVSSTGMVYFAVKHGCTSDIEGIPAGGGTASVIVTGGSLPAVSPDGTRLAYASEPILSVGCVPSAADLVPLYKVNIRTLSSGDTVSYQSVPHSQDSGLPAPISHLSWSADNVHLAVSISSVQDNEGWDLVLMDTNQAQYYLTGQGATIVRATGSPTPQRSYLREGVYMPSGNLFVSRACCAGFPVQNTSRLMWEVNPSGTLLHQVAIGYANLDHTSLDVSSDGHWLLYLAGHALYVSHDGATPKQLTSHLVAAAWAS